MSLLLKTLCLLNCRSFDCSLDCTPLCTSCTGCSPCCYPHPYNCKYFYSCNLGQYDIQQCPPNTGYNPETYTCEANFPCYLHDCLKLCSNIECQENCCSPNDCHTYFQCREGKRILKSCKDGSFNPQSLKCEANNSCIESDTTTSSILNKEEFLNTIYSIYRNAEMSILNNC